MNKIIAKQLDSLKIAQISEHVDNKYIFKKRESLKLEENKFYLIKLHRSLLSADDSDVVVYNLNKGTFPKYEYMKVNILKAIQGLVLVNGFYYNAETEQDIKDYWQGWLPILKLEVKGEL